MSILEYRASALYQKQSAEPPTYPVKAGSCSSFPSALTKNQSNPLATESMAMEFKAQVQPNLVGI